jgi:hypothetical protein
VLVLEKSRIEREVFEKDTEKKWNINEVRDKKKENK